MTAPKPKGKPTAKTPDAHARHSNGIPCGCWDGELQPTVTCDFCGATYLLSEVLSFPVWRCYDCGTAWRVGLPMLEPKP
jgi:hypothetical protein